MIDNRTSAFPNTKKGKSKCCVVKLNKKEWVKRESGNTKNVGERSQDYFLSQGASCTGSMQQMFLFLIYVVKTHSNSSCFFLPVPSSTRKAVPLIIDHLYLLRSC